MNPEHPNIGVAAEVEAILETGAGAEEQGDLARKMEHHQGTNKTTGSCSFATAAMFRGIW